MNLDEWWRMPLANAHTHTHAHARGLSQPAKKEKKENELNEMKRVITVIIPCLYGIDRIAFYCLHRAQTDNNDNDNNNDDKTM